MKKIPTLFERVFSDNKIIHVKSDITAGCENAFLNGIATVKIDGSCCAIIDGKFYKRYDAKKGKKPPEGAIPCCEPDPITGHWPHWVLIDENNPSDKWFVEAKKNSELHGIIIENRTYEAVGPHFNGNNGNYSDDFILPHGEYTVDVDRNLASIFMWLKENNEEGLVFWLNGEPVCKIKRTDFGLDWPIKEKK